MQNSCKISRRSAHASRRSRVDKRIKLEIWGKAQREFAWHPKSDWGKLEGGG